MDRFIISIFTKNKLSNDNKIKIVDTIKKYYKNKVEIQEYFYEGDSFFETDFDIIEMDMGTLFTNEVFKLGYMHLDIFQENQPIIIDIISGYMNNSQETEIYNSKSRISGLQESVVATTYLDLNIPQVIIRNNAKFYFDYKRITLGKFSEEEFDKNCIINVEDIISDYLIK